MEQIISLILFAFPGFFVKLLYKEFLPHSNEGTSEHESLTQAFLYSFGVLVLNLGILKVFFSRKFTSFTDMMNNSGNIVFLIKYIALTIFSSIVFAVIFRLVSRSLYLGVKNKLKTSKGLVQETIFPTVWAEVFQNPSILMDDTYIVVEKDGVVISQGILASYTSSGCKKEILLKHTQGVKNYIENDKNFPDNERLLGLIEKEYYDLESGVLIKIFDNTKIVNYLNEP